MLVVTGAISRNGLYLEPDVESIPDYIKAGKISNSAGNGKSGYTTREELAAAYIKLITNDKHNGKTYHVFGESITQQQLVDRINQVYDISLVYEPVSVNQYKKDRIAVHGENPGGIIAGIYEGIKNGAFDMGSDFKTITGRDHQSVRDFLMQSKQAGF